MTSHPVLALNANASVLGVWHWSRAINAIFRDVAYPLSEYDAEVRSPSRAFRIPSVVMLRKYWSHDRPASFTRRNVFLAYMTPSAEGPSWRCALSGRVVHDQRELTFDHVVPRSKGGATTWDNIVLATHAANNEKGDRTLERAGMRLHVRMRQPSEREIALADVLSDYQDPPTDWVDYLGNTYWTVPLDP